MFVVPEFMVKIGKRINDGVSVYTREMLAVLLALQWVRHETIKSSSSSLVSLQCSNSESRADILTEAQQTLSRIHMMGFTFVFLWIPAHYGVKANEIEARAAKEATKHVVVDLGISLGQTDKE